MCIMATDIYSHNRVSAIHKRFDLVIDKQASTMLHPV